MIAQEPPEGSTQWVCKADRLFDGETTRPDHGVIIENGLISAVMPVADLPTALPSVDAPGCTILPGLIDTHAHFMRWEGPSYLAYGVTTIRDVANRLDWILDRREEAQRHPWPRIYCTGPALDGPVAHWPEIALACSDADDAGSKIHELAACGVNGIKLYVRIPPDWLESMVKTAHDEGLPVMMHCGSVSALTAGRAGVDEFFHLDGLLDDIWPDHPSGWLQVWGHSDLSKMWVRQQEAADVIAELGLITTPTLTVWDMFWRLRFRDMPSQEDAPCIPPQLPKWFLPAQPEPAMGELWKQAIENAQRFVGLLIERSVTILPGTDVPFSLYSPGRTLWRELAFLVRCGMKPIDALRGATSQAARILRADRLGRLMQGYVADLIVVEGDPTKEIPVRPKVRTVIRAGHVHRPADLLAAAAEYAETFDEDPMAIAFQKQFRDKPM